MYGYTNNLGSSYLLMIVAIIISALAQFKITSTFSKYLRVRSKSGMRGLDVARTILDREGLYDIPVMMVEGHLSDHYDPRSKTVNLSRDVYSGDSIAAVSVAAHEVGHAIQHAQGYAPLSFRSALAPVAIISGNFVWILVMAGIVLSIPFLVQLGIYTFIVTVLFQVVTLPVEFNASKRALQQLENGLVTSDEISGSKKVLGAAAMTYVAATLVAVLQLLRLIMISSSKNND